MKRNMKESVVVMKHIPHSGDFSYHGELVPMEEFARRTGSCVKGMESRAEERWRDGSTS